MVTIELSDNLDQRLFRLATYTQNKGQHKSANMLTTLPILNR